jgi:hypothetical protein
MEEVTNGFYQLQRLLNLCDRWYPKSWRLSHYIKDFEFEVRCPLWHNRFIDWGNPVENGLIDKQKFWLEHRLLLTYNNVSVDRSKHSLLKGHFDWLQDNNLG